MFTITDYNLLGGTPPDPAPHHYPDPDAYELARIAEEYAENLLDRCRSFEFAKKLNEDHDLYDGDLLPEFLQAIAEWRGNLDSSHTQMKKLHNLFFDAVKRVAKRECKVD